MTDTRLDPFEHGLTGDAANSNSLPARFYTCLLYTSDAADE